MTTMRLAVQRPRTANGKGEADFIDCVGWDRIAENLANLLDTGRLVAVEGRLQINKWERDGVKHERPEIILRSFEVLDRAPAQDDDSELPI